MSGILNIEISSSERQPVGFARNSNSSFILRPRVFIICTLIANGLLIASQFSDHRYDLGINVGPTT